MALRFGLSKGYVDTLKNDVLPEGGMAMAGGAAGGLAFGLMANTKFFSELLMPTEAELAAKVAEDPKYTTDNIVLGKKLVLAAALGIGGGSALFMAGPMGVNAAKGLMGAMGATMAAVLWNKFAHDKTKVDSKSLQLQGTRVYGGELPAGLSGRLGLQVKSQRDYVNQAQLMSVLG